MGKDFSSLYIHQVFPLCEFSDVGARADLLRKAFPVITFIIFLRCVNSLMTYEA